MLATSFPEYAHHVQELLDRAVAAADVVLVRLEIDARSSRHGLVGGVLHFSWTKSWPARSRVKAGSRAFVQRAHLCNREPAKPMSFSPGQTPAE